MNKGRKTIVLVDGENLVQRYQDMVKDGKKNRAILHVPDTFVWSPSVLGINLFDVLRVSFYTTVVGDEPRVKEINELISQQKYHYNIDGTTEYDGTLTPHVFKKETRERKIRAVDINITIDALKYTYNNSADTIFIISGDGDYVPLIREIKGMGKLAIIGALSNGLNDQLKYTADQFYNLDSHFFEL